MHAIRRDILDSLLDCGLENSMIEKIPTIIAGTLVSLLTIGPPLFLKGYIFDSTLEDRSGRAVEESSVQHSVGRATFWIQLMSTIDIASSNMSTLLGV